MYVASAGFAVAALAPRDTPTHAAAWGAPRPAFLLYHSTEYVTAMLVAWLEFWLEAWLFPQFKGITALVAVGLAMVVCGQYFRAAAMWTAGQNFSHIIADEHKHNHVLVTKGVYKYVRVPHCPSTARVTCVRDPRRAAAGTCGTRRTSAGSTGRSGRRFCWATRFAQ